MLIAMPALREGPFARSLVYVCAHREDWAMGIIVNQRAEATNFPELLVQLEIVKPDEAIVLPPQAGEVRVLRGGPVERGRGFVLHLGDYFVNNSTVSIGDGICLTATLDILRAIAVGKGPKKAVFRSFASEDVEFNWSLCHLAAMSSWSAPAKRFLSVHQDGKTAGRQSSSSSVSTTGRN